MRGRDTIRAARQKLTWLHAQSSFGSPFSRALHRNGRTITRVYGKPFRFGYRKV